MVILGPRMVILVTVILVILILVTIVVIGVMIFQSFVCISTASTNGTPDKGSCATASQTSN